MRRQYMHRNLHIDIFDSSYIEFCTCVLMFFFGSWLKIAKALIWTLMKPWRMNFRISKFVICFPLLFSFGWCHFECFLVHDVYTIEFGLLHKAVWCLSFLSSLTKHLMNHFSALFPYFIRIIFIPLYFLCREFVT